VTGKDRERRQPAGFTRRVVSVARHPVGGLARWLFDLEITNHANLPEGPCVMAANHLSFIDPVLVTLVAKRNVRYLAVADLFDQHHLFDRLISFFGAIPTPRDRAPIAAIRAALAELDAGNPIGVFPEGRRVEQWRGETPQRGAAWLALAAGVPLVPIAMQGTEGTLSVRHGAFRRTAVHIWVEPPIDPHDYIDYVDPLGALTRAWHEAVASKLDPWWGESSGSVRLESARSGEPGPS